MYSVFTKPWKAMSLPELGEFVAEMGFDGIELPVRPGFQVEPEHVARLPKAAETLARCGIQIFSVAGPTDEATIAAYAEAAQVSGMQEMPTIRICVRIDKDDDYLSGEARLQSEFDVLVPLLDKYGVRLGIQNHCGRNVANAMGLRSLISRYDPRHIAAVWDAAHNALQGEDPDLALDIVWSHLCMVNLKNAYWKRMTGPEAEVAQWHWYWTNGRQGLASWPRVASELEVRDYSGVVCLTAEYSDHDSVNRLIQEDVAFAKELLGSRQQT
jgi:sugar phosphate isomerase/epimerase